MPDLAAYGKLGTLWCEIMHDSATWPIHGRYQCRTCGRLYAVPWMESRLPAPAVHARRIPSAFLPLVILLAVLCASPGRAADVVDSTAGASLAFARLTAGGEQSSPGRLE